ncbi:hypothetical protein BHE97_02740 [Aeromicrobium sp. PE09-221]|uniref:inositol monophosphatase family protein n=1 Tax=Aeromicrobium sp. PE09-221 TaxID=1898043 RepID=UPI000B3E8630|nr:inositol monophosphatase [Aeromicrobium sp. PE09-221]OUZ12128.1 hypothetical protein BHE97_02740 [Aeromicrobium sp. PE09-221]
MILDRDAVLATALELVRGGGELARRFAAEGIEVEAKDGTDQVTRTARDIERRMVHHLLARYPDHAILGEESGRHGPDEARVQWLLDPLDGTHNYAMGLDVYGVCLTILLDGRAEVAVVHDSPSGRSTSAVRGGGAWQEGRRLAVRDAVPLAHATVSWIQGYGIDPDDPARRAAFDPLERSAERVLRTWAPSRDWALLAEGGTDAVIAFRNEVWDLEGGALIAREAGAEEVRTEELVIVGVPAVVDELTSMLM